MAESVLSSSGLLSGPSGTSNSSIVSSVGGNSVGAPSTSRDMIKNAEFLSTLESMGREGKDWCTTYSLKSLKLTLEDILGYAKIERRNVLVEFPFFHYLKALHKIEELPQCPSRPQPQMNQTKLAQKKKELRLLVRFYENRIHWLCHGSRKYFGLIQGSRIAIVVETSDLLFNLESGIVMTEYCVALNKLVEDQLEKKDLVYCIQYGSSPNMTNQQGYPFFKFEKHCAKHVKEWINGLQKSGTNNLFSALKMSMTIKDLDTVVVIMTTDPDQPLDIIQHYMVDRLAGERHPKLHLVSFRATSHVQTSFRDLAQESHGHYHVYTPDQWKMKQASSTRSNAKEAQNSAVSDEVQKQPMENRVCELLEDSDVDSVWEEISKARRTLIDIESVKSGLLDYTLLEQLRELAISIDWEEDDDFPGATIPMKHPFIPCSTDIWAKKYGLNSQGLNVYKFLAPDAYPQLKDHVNVTNSTVVSQVYDVMPLLSWEDGSMKYIHVDVHRIEQYLSSLDAFLVDTMLERLGWQLSGSRVPFGVLMERRVLLVLDCSCAVMGEVLGLQQHLRMLLKEQLAHTQDFNLVSYGKSCRLWTSGFAEPHRQSLLQAWEWVLGLSPEGSADLLTALKAVFESGRVWDDQVEEEYDDMVGVYLIASALPDQSTDILCGYLEQVLSGLNIRFHAIFYDTEMLTGTPEFQLGGGTGGRCGLESQVEDCLRALAKVGHGTFHHFKVSGSCEGEELTKMVAQVDTALGYSNTARKLLEGYRLFCKRSVPPPASMSDERVCCQSPLPAYPRQTTTSLARMNSCLNKKQEKERKHLQSQKLILKAKGRLFCVKDHFWYTGRGLKKINASEVVIQHSRKRKYSPLIPVQEDLVTSEKWLSLYGLNALHLTYQHLMHTGNGGHSTFKHYNSQGELVELQVNAQGLKEFRYKMRSTLARLCSRLNWLTQGYRKYLGAICEKEVIVLVDVSSSVTMYLPEIKEAMTSLLDNMPIKIRRFNMLAYSTTVDKWRANLQLMTKKCDQDSDIKSTSESAIQWIDSLKTGGSSYLLQALKEGLESGAQGIYLITDGSTDHTHDFLLQQFPILKIKYPTQWRINTVAWKSSKRDESFLRELAHRTGGRYHSYPDLSDADDYKLLHKEIMRTERELAKVDDFKVVKLEL